MIFNDTSGRRALTRAENGSWGFAGLVSLLFALAMAIQDALQILPTELAQTRTFWLLVKPLAVKMVMCGVAYWVVLLVLRGVGRWEKGPLAVAVGVFMSGWYRLDALQIDINLPSVLAKTATLVVGVAGVMTALMLVVGSYYLAKVMFRSRWGAVMGAVCLATPFVLVETFGWVWLNKYMLEPLILARMGIREKLFSAPVLLVNIGYVVVVLATLVLFVRLRRKRAPQRLMVGLAAAVFIVSTLVLTQVVGAVGAVGANVRSGHSVKRVILIVVDTLRADALSCYGGGRISTPAMDSLAADSIVFERAYAAAPWTMPSMTSIMTGLSPMVHMNIHYQSRLPDAYETLAERLGDDGYLTWAIGSNLIIRRRNLEQGFTGFDFFPRRADSSVTGERLARWWPRMFSGQAPTPSITDRAMRWLARYGDEDFFLWVHYFDPHEPYAPPRELLQEAQPPKDMGMRFADKTNVRAGLRKLSVQQRDWVHKLYDAEVLHVDENLGRLLADLRQAGLYDESLIILTSDHGEELWEHNGYEHGHALYNEQLWVPLMIKPPGPTAPLRVAEPVSLARLMPTILDLCGVEYERDYRSYDSLMGFWSSQREGQTGPIVSTGLLFYEEQESVIFDGMKYIRRLVSGREELYDLTVDPGEKNSIMADGEGAVKKAKEILQGAHEDAERLQEHYQTTGEKTKLDSATTERLRSLGYVQ